MSISHLERKELYAQIKKKAEQDYVIPGSRRTRVAEETIRSWLKKYRVGGFDALLPKERQDKGKARRLPLELPFDSGRYMKSPKPRQ